MSETYDDECRRLGVIFPGKSLSIQIENARYMVSRGAGSIDSLERLLRAQELRENEQ